MNDRHHNPSDFARSPADAGRDAFDRDERLSDELLSAYLDGECTAEEQAEVEALIAANPELRQLAEDLRNVRANLELLPQHRLEANFAERVLRRAEREVLTGDRGLTRAPATAADVATGEHETKSSAQSVSPSRRERSGFARPFLWTVAALAAAVLILITNRDPEIHRDPIARGPEAKFAAADKSKARSAAPGDDGDRTADVARRSKVMRKAEAPALQEALGDTPDLAQEIPEESGERANRAAGVTEGTDVPMRQPMPTAIPRAEPAADKLRLRRAEARPERQDSTPAPPPSSARALGLAAAAPPADEVDANDADLDQNGQARSEAQSLAANGVEAANADSYFTFAPPAESLQVVELLVGRDAWQRGDVTEVFANNRIALFDAAAAAETTAETTPGATAPRDKADNQGQVDEKLEVQLAKQAAPAEGLELFMVCAPAAQLEAALDDFQQQEQFRVVQVTDASAPEQLFEQSSRARGVDRRTPGYGGGYGYGSGRGYGSEADQQPKSWFLPLKKAGKTEVKATGEARSADAQVQQPAGDALNKDLQSAKVAADAKAAEALPAATGRYGGTAEIVEWKKSRLLRDGYGGVGGGPTNFAGGTAPQETAADVPLGYGQRVPLQQTTLSNREPASGIARQAASRPEVAEPRQKEAASNASLTPERMLFVFRVVDSAMVGEPLERGNAAGSRVGPAQRTEPILGGQGGGKAPLEPAPAAAGTSAR